MKGNKIKGLFPENKTDEEMKGDILEPTSNSRNGRSLPARTCLKKNLIGLRKERRSPTLEVGQLDKRR